MILSKNRVKTLKMICCTSSYKSCVRGNNKHFINEIQVSWGHNHQNHSLITEPLRVTSDQLATVLHFSVTKTMAVASQLTATIIYTSLYKSLDPCY